MAWDQKRTMALLLALPPLSVFHLYYKRFISLLPAQIFSRCLQQLFGVGSAGAQQGGNRLAA